MEFLSFFCEFLALFLAFFLKETRIFFLTFILLILKIPYFFASTLQANFFVSLFLPMIFLLFSIKKMPILIKDKQNFSALFVLMLLVVLGIFLPNNTNFNSANSGFHFLKNEFFRPINELGFIFFIFALIFISLINFKHKNFLPLIGLIFAYFPFLFERNSAFGFIEFTSLIFCIFLIKDAYKMAFFDDLTKLANEKKLELFLKGRKNYYLLILKFEQDKKQKIAQFLEKNSSFLKNIRKFLKNDDLILFFETKDEALKQKDEFEKFCKGEPKISLESSP